jgi:hypothetical protein
MAIPVAAVAITSAAVFAASPAVADVVDSGGSAVITVPLSYLHTLANAETHLKVLAPATKTVSRTAKTATFTFPGEGGDANAAAFGGTLNLGGTIIISSEDAQGEQDAVTLTNVQLSLDDGAIEGTPVGTSTPVMLLDLNGDVLPSSTLNPDGITWTDSVTASDLTIDPDGAAYLNSVLGTQVFQPGADTGGSLAATWTRSGS